jgi:predicted GH43/DUF377 family glycosyl hydrolase
VIARLFLPGEEQPQGSRAAAVVARVLALDEDDVARLVAGLIADFGPRHRDYPRLLAEHASLVGSRLRNAPAMSVDRTLLLGAVFTAEYAIEAAALCNPSAVRHPDQSGLEPGQLRVALSLRGIGEGHVSSIGFAVAVIGPGPSWSFEPRPGPLVPGHPEAASWDREHLQAVLADQGPIDELAHGVLDQLPGTFGAQQLQSVLANVPPDLLNRSGSDASLNLLRRLVASSYAVDFPTDSSLSQRVLLPWAAEESNGMEDARFVRFTDADDRVDYRATYTAYDGRQIASRLLTSPDLRTFRAQRLAGPGARNKGMALFPRLLADGRYWALCRSDGESNYLASSADGLSWDEPQRFQAPAAAWEVLQVGNCGPPIETPEGWLVLTHGVGAMRTYSIGALLLDRTDPRRVIARLEQPLLRVQPGERDGYVPNVVYSCGALAHDGRLWIPYGIGDTRVGVASIELSELLGEMVELSTVA